MKIRTDFVSNSSSSSFLVAFDQEITEEYLKEILYDNAEKSGKYDVKELCKSIMMCAGSREEDGYDPAEDEIPDGKVTGRREVIDVMRIGFEPVYINREYGVKADALFRAGQKVTKDFNKNDGEISQETRDEYKKAKEELDNVHGCDSFSELVDKFLEDNKDKVWYKFSFADEDGNYWSHLEHGGTFDNVNHVWMSCH